MAIFSESYNGHTKIKDDPPMGQAKRVGIATRVTS